MKYPCHSALEERWFTLTVTPLADAEVNGVVVMHSDITDRKLSEHTERRMATAMDAMGDPPYLVDRKTMSLSHVNNAACRLHRRTREELLSWTPWRVHGTTRESLEQTYDSLIASGRTAMPIEILRHREDGTPLWVELRRHAQHSVGRWTIITMVRDITERKNAERRIQRLNRMYVMLSSVNILIVRVRDRYELFKGACQIAQNVGGFRMAWIDIVDRGAMKIVPIASAGLEPEFLTVAKDWLWLSGEASGRDTMSVRAVRNRETVVLNDIHEDSNILAAKTRFAQGIHSMVALPLMIADVAVGVLTLYAADVDFFDDEELVLLRKMAGDIAFAIDHIDK